jgi:hypothetical protein
MDFTLPVSIVRQPDNSQAENLLWFEWLWESVRLRVLSSYQIVTDIDLPFGARKILSSGLMDGGIFIREEKKGT